MCVCAQPYSNFFLFFFFSPLMNKTWRPFMHEIHLGLSDARAFSSPSVSVTSLVLIYTPARNEFGLVLSFMCNLFYPHTLSAARLGYFQG